MLTLFGRRHRYCDGLSRRSFLTIGGLAGLGAQPAQAQTGVPYGPYSMTRGQFNQYAPVYYPRLYNNYGMPYYSRIARPFRVRNYQYNQGIRTFTGRRYYY